MKIGICTGGGDCPGLNAVIRSAVKYAHHKNIEVIGIKDSFNGLMDRPYGVSTLTPDSVTDILFKGGTIIGTTNSGNPFSLKNSDSNQPYDKSNLVLEAYRDLGLDCLVVIGGDGTQGIAYQLSKLGINVIGVPKTIDNDLAATDQTVGFDSALQVASDAAFRLQSTAESHDRVMILEVMGRGAGHLALHSGLASGAHIILIPEIPFHFSQIESKIQQRQKKGRGYSVIVVAEGAMEVNATATYSKNPSGSHNLGGIGHLVGQRIYDSLNIETRVTVLGHTQRGGTPSAVDRVLGSAYGVYAIDMVLKKAYGKIVSYQSGGFTEIDYTDVAGSFRPVDPDDIIIHTAEAMGVCLGR